MQDIVTNLKYYKTEVMRFGFFMLLSCTFFNCQKEALSAKQIIKKSIEVHGGIDNWKNIKQLSFDKQTVLYHEDGSVELKTDQFQLFKLQPIIVW